MSEQDDLQGLSGDERIVQEAKSRWKRCSDWEATFRERFIEDVKFDAGDSDNNYQWPNRLVGTRIDDDRPCLTINKTQQHNKAVINDAKLNKPAIKIIATGGEASFKSAQVYADICRHIEYRSNAEAAYDTAISFAVRGGKGYTRIIADYERDDSFDQSLFIRRVKDTLSVYLDPDINEEDGSDARFGLIWEDSPRDEVLKHFPKLKDKPTGATIDATSWMQENHIRVAEYYRRVEVKDKLILVTEPDTMPDGVTPNPSAGQQSMVKASTLPKELVAMIMESNPRTRPIVSYKVEWYKIVGDTIVDRRVGEDALPIPYIPIARCIGEESVIDGEYDCKGLTRLLKDPQRMLNYNASGSVEFGALQSKSPYIGAARAIEGYETYWRTANRVNHSLLAYNDYDEDTQTPIPPPQRQDPPQSAPVFMQGQQDAINWMMMVSGQYQSQTGEQENAKTAPAINARARQGDRATFHFLDSQARMIRYIGKILISWIPHVYDTKRVIKIRAEDGAEQQIQVDPTARQALQQTEQKDPRTQDVSVQTIFNPSVGRYDVEADVGPGYATKRQEAFNAYSQLAQSNPEAMNVMGDYVFKTMDVPFADEIAERWKRKIPADIKGEAPPPEVGMLTMQVENMKSALADLIKQVAEKDLELERSKNKSQNDAHRAETERMKVLSTGMQPQEILALVGQLVNDALSTNIVPQDDVSGQGMDPNAMGEGMPDPMQGMPQMQGGM